jgi:NADH-quinone oxidoreductase subunit J
VLVAQNVGFGIIAAIMVVRRRPGGHHRQRGARRAVLVMVLAGAAAQYLLLGAEFVAVTQVLVYIGAIVVLFLFGIMLTRAPMLGTEKPSPDNWIVLGARHRAGDAGRAGLRAARRLRPRQAPRRPRPHRHPRRVRLHLRPVPGARSRSLSVLLLAALIGAIVIARRD